MFVCCRPLDAGADNCPHSWAVPVGNWYHLGSHYCYRALEAGTAFEVALGVDRVRYSSCRQRRHAPYWKKVEVRRAALALRRPVSREQWNDNVCCLPKSCSEEQSVVDKHDRVQIPTSFEMINEFSNQAKSGLGRHRVTP